MKRKTRLEKLDERLAEKMKQWDKELALIDKGLRRIEAKFGLPEAPYLK